MNKGFHKQLCNEARNASTIMVVMSTNYLQQILLQIFSLCACSFLASLSKNCPQRSFPVEKSNEESLA